MLSSALECASITDLCKENLGKKSRKTGAKKVGGGAQLVPSKFKGEAAGDGVDVKHVDGTSVGKDENNAVVDNAEEVGIKRCELIMSKISLAKLGKEVDVSHTNAKARPARKAKIVKSVKPGACAFVSASVGNGSSVELTDDSQVVSRKRQAGQDGKKSADEERAKVLSKDCSHQKLGGGVEAGFKKAANAKILGKSCEEKTEDKVVTSKKEIEEVNFSMKRCDVSIGRISLSQQRKKTDIKQTKQAKKMPERKSKASGRSLAEPCASVSSFDDIDSSIEVLNHSQDLSWELIEGGTWNETNKQSKKEARKSPKKSETEALLPSSKEYHGPDKLPRQVTVSKKRKQAPLASDNLENECIVNLNHCVEDEVEEETDQTSKDGEGGQYVKMFHSTMVKGYDCINADPTYVCVFCHQQPHRYGLGDLFGPYFVEKGDRDVWTHVDCAVWVPCVLLEESSGEVEGLSEAIRQTRKQACSSCNLRGASISCTSPGCTQTTHVRCAAGEGWRLVEENFKATCSLHLEM